MAPLTKDELFKQIAEAKMRLGEINSHRNEIRHAIEALDLYNVSLIENQSYRFNSSNTRELPHFSFSLKSVLTKDREFIKRMLILSLDYIDSRKLELEMEIVKLEHQLLTAIVNYRL